MQIYYSKVTVSMPVKHEKVAIGKERFDEILRRLSDYHSSLQEIVDLDHSDNLEGGAVKEVDVSALERQAQEVAKLSKELIAEAGR